MTDQNTYKINMTINVNFTEVSVNNHFPFNPHNRNGKTNPQENILSFRPLPLPPFAPEMLSS